MPWRMFSPYSPTCPTIITTRCFLALSLLCHPVSYRRLNTTLAPCTCRRAVPIIASIALPLKPNLHSLSRPLSVHLFLSITAIQYRGEVLTHMDDAPMLYYNQHFGTVRRCQAIRPRVPKRPVHFRVWVRGGPGASSGDLSLRTTSTKESAPPPNAHVPTAVPDLSRDGPRTGASPLLTGRQS